MHTDKEKTIVNNLQKTDGHMRYDILRFLLRKLVIIARIAYGIMPITEFNNTFAQRKV